MYSKLPISTFDRAQLNHHSRSWRWIYRLNLPVGGVAMIMQFFFLQIVFVKRTTIRKKLGQIDWLGNLVLVSSVVTILIALSWANTWAPDTHGPHGTFSCPLCIIGIAGIALFYLYESSKFPVQPTIPPRMFANRTSAVGLVLTLLQSMLTMWRFYFLPVYFQTVLLVSPSRSGVLLLPTILVGIPMAIVSGQILTR